MNFRAVLFMLIAVVAVLAFGGALVLDLTVPQWDDNAPFTAAFATAVLTTPVVVLLTAAVFDKLLNRQLEVRQKALRGAIASGIESDFDFILGRVVSELFESGARFPSLKHLEVVLSASATAYEGKLSDDVIRARDTGAVAVVRRPIPVNELEIAAARYDAMIDRLGRLAEMDPDYLVLHEQSQLMADNNHLQIKRYTEAGGRGLTPDFVRLSWWITVISGSKILRSINGEAYTMPWTWPAPDGRVDIPRPEREPVRTTMWEAASGARAPGATS